MNITADVRGYCASECAGTLGVSKSTWKLWGKTDPRRPSPFYRHGRVVLWDPVKVIEYRDVRATEKEERTASRARDHPPAEKRPPAPRGSPAKRRRREPLLEEPKTYATSDSAELLYQVHRRSDGRHALYEVTRDGVPHETEIVFSADPKEMMAEFLKWTAANMPEDAEIWPRQDERRRR